VEKAALSQATPLTIQYRITLQDRCLHTNTHWEEQSTIAAPQL